MKRLPFNGIPPTDTRTNVEISGVISGQPFEVIDGVDDVLGAVNSDN